MFAIDRYAQGVIDNQFTYYVRSDGMIAHKGMASLRNQMRHQMRHQLH